jgi:hypothetical protein
VAHLRVEEKGVKREGCFGTRGIFIAPREWGGGAPLGPHVGNGKPVAAVPAGMQHGSAVPCFGWCRVLSVGFEIDLGHCSHEPGPIQ